MTDEAPAAAGASKEDEGVDDSKAGNEEVDFGGVSPPIFEKGAWFKVESRRDQDFCCKAFDQPAPYGTQIYERFRIGRAFGPALCYHHTQAHRRGKPFAFVTAHVRLEGLDAWINAWCNRNKGGRRQPTFYARPTDPPEQEGPSGRFAATAAATSARPADDTEAWTP